MRRNGDSERAMHVHSSERTCNEWMMTMLLQKKKQKYTIYQDDHKEETTLNPCTKTIVMPILGMVMLDSL